MAVPRTSALNLVFAVLALAVSFIFAPNLLSRVKTHTSTKQEPQLLQRPPPLATVDPRMLAMVSRLAMTGDGARLQQLMSAPAFAFGEHPPGSQRGPLHYALLAAHSSCERGSLPADRPQGGDGHESATGIGGSNEHGAHAAVIEALMRDIRTDPALWCPLVDAIHLRNIPALGAIARGSTSYELQACLDEVNVDGDTVLHVLGRSSASGLGRFIIRNVLGGSNSNGDRDNSAADAVARRRVLRVLRLDTTRAVQRESERHVCESKRRQQHSSAPVIGERRISRRSIDAASHAGDAWLLRFTLRCAERARGSDGGDESGTEGPPTEDSLESSIDCYANSAAQARERAHVKTQKGPGGDRWYRNWLERRNAQNQTALLVACSSARAHVIEALVRSGADIKARNGLGQSCKDILLRSDASTTYGRSVVIASLRALGINVAAGTFARAAAGADTSNASVSAVTLAEVPSSLGSSAGTKPAQDGIGGWCGTPPILFKLLRRHCRYCAQSGGASAAPLRQSGEQDAAQLWHALLDGPRDHSSGERREKFVPSSEHSILSLHDLHEKFIERSPLLVRGALRGAGWRALGVVHTRARAKAGRKRKRPGWDRASLLRSHGDVQVSVGALSYADSYGAQQRRQSLRSFIEQHMPMPGSTEETRNVSTFAAGAHAMTATAPATTENNSATELRAATPPYVFDSGVLTEAADLGADGQRRITGMSHRRRRRSLRQQLSDALAKAPTISRPRGQTEGARGQGRSQLGVDGSLFGSATSRVTLYQWMIGPALSGSQPHFHGNAWNGLVYGLKLWLIFPPQHAFFSNMTALEWFLLQRANFHPCSCIAADNCAVMGNSTTAQPPANTSSCTVFSVLQRPGDIVYVPSQWGHVVLNLADSLGVALEFLPAQPPAEQMR